MTPRPAPPCGHPGAHEFVSFRGRSQADKERELMLTLPEWAGHHMSPVYRSRSGGWAWRVCPECESGAREATSGF